MKNTRDTKWHWLLRHKRTLSILFGLLLIGGLVVASTVYVSFYWQIGNTTPSISLWSPSDDSEVNTENITFMWNSSDPDIDEVLTHIWYLDVVDTFSSPHLQAVALGNVSNYTGLDIDDGEWFWRVYVSDDGGEHNITSTWNFTVRTNDTNQFPTLSNGTVTPSNGTILTDFNYTVNVTDLDNETPVYIYVQIDGVNHSMTPLNSSDTNLSDGKDYYYNTTLGTGVHNYSFLVSDLFSVAATGTTDGPNVTSVGLGVPSIDSVTPSDNATQIGLPLSSFNVTVSDTDEDLLNISLWTNHSGSWVLFNTSLGVNPGSYGFTNTSWVTGFDALFYWSVNITDGVFWTNQTFSFRSEALSVTVLYPTNGSVCSSQPTVVFSISSPHGRSMNYSLSVDNGTGVFGVVSSGSNVGNGTYTSSYVLAYSYGTSYLWRVNLTDGYSWVNESYSFTPVSPLVGGGNGGGDMMGVALGACGLLFGLLALVFALDKRRGR